MKADDFALYCIGVAIVLVSVATVVWIISRVRIRWPKSAPQRQRSSQPEQTDIGLINRRLHELQRAHFATPIPPEMLQQMLVQRDPQQTKQIFPIRRVPDDKGKK